MKKITISVPDQIYSIASEKAYYERIDIVLYCTTLLTEALLDESALDGMKIPKSKRRTKANEINHSIKKGSKVPDTLKQVFAICDEVWNHGKDFQVAVQIVALNFGVQEGTVRDKLTRRISIKKRIVDTNYFRYLLSNRDVLIRHLIIKFPKFKNLIRNTLGSSEIYKNFEKVENKGIKEPPNSITQDKFLSIVIKILQQLGGKAPKKKVEAKIAELHNKKLKHPWYQEYVGAQPTVGYAGVPRWKKNVQFARNTAREYGFIKPTEKSGRGIWELTEEGMNY